MADAAPAEVLDDGAVARLGALRSLAGRDVLGELIALFSRGVPRQIAACREALGRGDAEALRRAAHAVRGDAGALGALELAALCARIETEAAEDRPGDLAAMVDALDPAFRRATAALAAVAAAPDPAPL